MEPRSQRTALVIEDDDDIGDLVSHTLTGAGFQVSRAPTGAEGVAMSRSIRPDLITLDLTLPDMDGLEVCRQIRTHSDCYIVMLTARDDEVDMLVGLGIGADDYISKPFSPRALSARVAAISRRPRSSIKSEAAGPATIEAGSGLSVDPLARIVRIDGSVITLTRTEFDLLHHLAGRPGEVVDRAVLVTAVWGHDGTVDRHLVNVHMGNLRRKLRKHSAVEWISTVRGVGYRFDLAT